jgi:Ser/Thr protein kinase RdoA (MazF antagonist)
MAERTWEHHWEIGDEAGADAFVELGPSDAVAMLDSVGLVAVGEPEPLPSDENRVFRVDLSDGPIVLKIFRYSRSSAAVLTEQLEFVDRLAAAGISVARARHLPDGGWLGEWEGQLFALFEWWDEVGDSPVDDTGADFRALGADVARMHLLGADVRLEHQLPYTPETWGRASLEHLLGNEIVHALYRSAFSAKAEEVLRRSAAEWPPEPPVPIHSDLGRWNVLWPPRSAPVMIDFEDLGVGTAWQDLYLLPHSFVNNRVCDADTADRIGVALREGYTSVRAIPEGDAALSALIEAMRGLYIDCWISARRHDRHFGVRRLTFHTKSYWEARVARLDRYLSIR